MTAVCLFCPIMKSSEGDLFTFLFKVFITAMIPKLNVFLKNLVIVDYFHT